MVANRGALNGPGNMDYGRQLWWDAGYSACCLRYRDFFGYAEIHVPVAYLAAAFVLPWENPA